MRILIVISLLGLMIFHSAPSALVASDNSTNVAEPEYEEEGIQVEDAVIAGAVLWAMYALFFSPEIDEYLFGDVNTEQFPKNKKLNQNAGLELAKHIRENDSDMPIVLQSTNSEHKAVSVAAMPRKMLVPKPLGPNGPHHALPQANVPANGPTA